MSKLSPSKLVTPQSLLIEKTALEMAAVFWEAGRSAGMPSKYKNARAFAKAKVTMFIPKAVEHLLELLGKDYISKEQKDLIYEAIMERANDQALSESGIPVFKVPIEYKSDKYVPPAPLVINTNDSIEKILKNSSTLTTVSALTSKVIGHG